MENKVNFSNLIFDKEKYENYTKKNTFILDKQLDKLPKKIQFCKLCIGSNQRPRTEFDKDGVCNACRYARDLKFSKKGIDWDKREDELKKLCLDLLQQLTKVLFKFFFFFF